MTPPWCESKGHYSRDSTGLHTRRGSRAPVGVESTLLEVLEPPIVPPGFERGKPLACEIEQHDSYAPYQVKKWKAPDVTFRWFWIAHWMVGEQPCANDPQPDLRHHESERVDQGNVEHVEEERDTAEDRDSAGEAAV